MSKKIIKIKGMRCKSCAESIEKKLGSLGGVESVKVILQKDEAEVKFNPNKISLEKIKSEISRLGYSVSGKEERGQKQSGKTFLQGLAYGLIPHIGCIAFVVGSILGVTVLINFFRPLLMNRYFFHALVGVSLGFATLSSAFYLSKNGLLSWEGIRKKWKYLSVMYGSTIGINLLLFMLIFPLLANVSVGLPLLTGAALASGNENTDSLLKLKVDIPCPGHAPLISQELKNIDGVSSVTFSFPDYFDVIYDPTKTSEQEILSLEVFKTYEATALDVTPQNTQLQNKQQSNQINSCCGGGRSGGINGCCGFKR